MVQRGARCFGRCVQMEPAVRDREVIELQMRTRVSESCCYCVAHVLFLWALIYSTTLRGLTPTHHDMQLAMQGRPFSRPSLFGFPLQCLIQTSTAPLFVSLCLVHRETHAAREQWRIRGGESMLLALRCGCRTIARGF